ncbi:MAG: FMN-binding protein [Ruminococcus sp.]
MTRKEWLKKCTPLCGFLPIAVLAVCTAVSLSGYTPPVLTMEMETVQAEGTDAVTETETSDWETSTKTTTATAPTVAKVSEFASYRDGTYTGTGTGFSGPITVQVVIADGKIKDITIVSTTDDSPYVDAAAALLKNIISAQSTNVDTVSGATYSSVGLIEAVRDALQKAGGDSSADTALPVLSAPSQNVQYGQGNAPTVQTVSEPAAYRDGTYTGTGTGFSGPITVKVTVQGGKISDISLVSTTDDSPYIDSAAVLLQNIVQMQSTNVDTVSGATYSSAGLIEAVRNALASAAVHGNTTPAATTAAPQMTESTTESVAVTGKFPYPDGIYLGTGSGYRGDITVAVSIQNKSIDTILILQTEEDEVFFQRAETLVDTVLKQQTTAVDVVSGATYSSEGILEAIENALTEAQLAADGDTADESSTESTEEISTPEEIADGMYADGDYTAIAICYPDALEEFEAYTLSVTVRIQDGKIVEITDVGSVDDEDADNAWYIKRAVSGTSKIPGVVSQILEKQTAEDVDAVSGATCSSDAMIQAIKEALQEATQ